MLIIDDWEEIPLNRNGRTAFLQEATQHFSTVVLLVDDVFLIKELSGRQEDAPLGDFAIADIKEFGFHLRGLLTRKWHSLGQTFVEDEQAFARSVSESTRVIDTVLGRNLLPSHPVNILTLLQTYDAGAGSQNSGLGSYGQVYEALITARLAKTSMRSTDIGTKITFLSRVAWAMFSGQKRYVDRAEWAQLADDYFAVYKIRIEYEQLLSTLIVAGLLTEDPSGYQFTYAYIYCYFVAKYFQENLADLDPHIERRALFLQLQSLSERVYAHDNANIVIFYVFLTKDRELIYHIIASARRVFVDVEEFDFDSQVSFINFLSSSQSEMRLPDGDPVDNRQAYDQRRDASGEQIEPQGDQSLPDVVYSKGMPYEQELIFGIRYLTLMGQVLRNFPGSLKAETKLELAFESYALGLRILGSVFSLAQRDAATISQDISSILRTKMAFSGTDRELRERVDTIIAEILREISFALLKRMSHAIGLKELEAIYAEVSVIRDNSLPSRLIQLSIRLDHFERFPKMEIGQLARDLQRNMFGFQTLRDLVANHLYLFPTEYTVRQWAGELLSFKVDTPQIRGTGGKLISR